METLYRKAPIRIADDSEESRTVQFVISDETKDRHRTVLNMDGWDLENFNSNGIVGYQHDVYGNDMCRGADPDLVIGKGRAWIEDETIQRDGSTTLKKVLIGEVTFEPADVNPLAEKIFRKVMHGTLKATSVGFSAIGGGRMVNDETGDAEVLKATPSHVPKGHTFYYSGQELLEFSVVNIPSNPKALKRTLRNQAANALHFLKRELGQDVTYGEIEQMRVLDLIKMLETGKMPEKKETPDTRSKDDLEKELHNEEKGTSKEGAPLRLKYKQKNEELIL